MATVEESGIDRFFVGGGAEHTPESVRRFLFTATGGASGVSTPTALRVRPLTIPGGGVHILTGSCLIRSKYVGGSDQTYQAAIYRQQEVEVPENTSGITRHDLLILNVEDPFMAGSTWTQPSPEDAAQEQYVYPRLITGVPATAKRIQDVPGYENYTAETLYRVSLPALTGTVLLEHLTDLREVAAPEEKIVIRAFGVGAAVHKLTASGAYPAGTTWPNEALAEANFVIEIPEWATQWSIISTVSGIKMMDVTTLGGDAAGWTWVQVGGNSHPDVVRTEPTRWDADKKSAMHRTIFRTADTRTIPVSMRGTTQRFYPRGNVTSESQAPGTTYSGPRANNPFIPFPVADSGTSVDLMIVFRRIKE